MPAADLNGYHVHWVNAQPVTYSRYQTVESLAVPVALKREVSRDDVVTFAITPESDTTVWHLPRTLLQAVGVTRPKRHDRIVEADGSAWRIDVVELQTCGTRYRFVCTREVADA